MNNILFVKAVQRRPCLYNSSDLSYRFKKEMNIAWDEIGKSLGLTGAACREKWRNLRIAFLRYLRLHAIGKQPKPYYLMEHMRFLTPFLKGQNIPHEYAPFNTSDDEADAGDRIERQIDDDPIVSQTKITEFKTEPEIRNNREEYEKAVDSIEDVLPTAKIKKPNEEQLENTNMTNLKRKSSESQTSIDPISSFLDSLDPELREMNTQQFKTFKRMVLLLVDSIMGEKMIAATSKDC